MVNHQIVSLLQAVPYLQGMPVEILLPLANSAVPICYSAGTLIFIEGDPCAGLYLIESGKIKISRFSKDGREYILHMSHPGDTFNDVAVLDGQHNPVTATAYTDVHLWRFVRRDLRCVVEQHPRLAWTFAEHMARRARFMAGVVHDLSMRNVRGRLAHLLLSQARENTSNEVSRMLTQEEMASHLGTVREVVGRTLRALASEGVIDIDRHRIIILDEARLEAEAEI